MSHHANYLVCIDNAGYPASLEPRKIYQQLPWVQFKEHAPGPRGSPHVPQAAGESEGRDRFPAPIEDTAKLDISF